MKFIKLNKENTPIYTLNGISFYKMSTDVIEEDLTPTSEVVYKVSEDGTYAYVDGILNTWQGGELVFANNYMGLPVKEIKSVYVSDGTNGDLLEYSAYIAITSSIYIPDNVEIMSHENKVTLTGMTALNNISIGNNVKEIVPVRNSLYTENVENVVGDVVCLHSRDGTVTYAVDVYNKSNEVITIPDICNVLCSFLIVSTVAPNTNKVDISKNVKRICSSAFSMSGFTPIIKTLIFRHLPEDELSFGNNIIISKDAINVTIYHKNNPSVLNYDWAGDNVTPTFVELTD